MLKPRLNCIAGTPTPSTPTSHVAHLQPLLSFLGQQPYGTQRNFWEVRTAPASFSCCMATRASSAPVIVGT